MRCPRCNLVFDERFCPQCGLDLEIYAEVAILKGEVESLRQLVLSGTQVSLPGSSLEPEVAADSAGIQRNSSAEGQTPPPLPPGLIKAERRKSGNQGSSAELAVGQKWLLGIGVLILIIGIGFFLKFAFDQQWVGPSVRIFPMAIMPAIPSPRCCPAGTCWWKAVSPPMNSMGQP